jgi:uncharacterized membrane protein YfcA
MPRGGLPISGVALPLLVLLWPEQGQAARSAVSFILPLLCVMDIVGVILYRGKPDWSHIKKLLPSAIADIIIASLLFVSDSCISFSDRTLKLIPFALLGRFQKEQLIANLWILPIIPAGVLIGYVIVRTMPELYYRRFIYLALSLTSGLLVYNALTAG